MRLRCPNCKVYYRRSRDKEYLHRVVHNEPSCPYRFDFAHDNARVIWRWVKDLYCAQLGIYPRLQKRRPLE